MTKFIASAYRWLYTRIGGRPWTFIIRDSHKNHPLPWAGFYTSIGILLGHLFW